MSKKILAILMVAVFVLPSIGIGISFTDDSSAATKRTVIVETSPDFAPYDYYYGTEFAGIDMDIIRAIGKDTGINFEFRQNGFNSIIGSVSAGVCDMGASGFTIRDDRKESVDFSIPYATIRQVAVGKVGLDITSEDDLKKEDYVLVGQINTSGVDYAEQSLRSKGGSVVQLNTYSDIVLALKGNSDYIEIVDNPVAEAQVSANPDLKIYDVLNAGKEEYGFIFHHDNDELRGIIDKSLTKLQNNGTVDKIIRYYSDNGFRADTPSYYNQVPTLFVLSDEAAPYSYERLSEQAGIEADILAAVAKDWGYKIRYVDIESDELASRVIESQNYVAIGNLAPRQVMVPVDPDDLSAGLKETLAFTKPYTTDNLVLVAPKNAIVSDATILDGMKVGTVEYTKGKECAEENEGLVTEYATAKSALDALIRGDVLFAIVDYASAKANLYNYEDEYSINEVIDESYASEIGFMVGIDSTDLLERLNATLDKLKEDGTIEAIEQYYANAEYNPETVSYFDDTDNSFWGKLWDRIERCFLENDRWELYITGLQNTLKITVVALLIGLVIGLLIATVMSVNAQSGRLVVLSWICRAYVTVIRGTPVMVQLLLIYYVVFASSSLNPVLVASVAFGINSGAYIAEIVRSGMNSVPKGQMEAARCLGLDTTTSMKSVVVPQAIRNIMPALGNESISLLKETSIAGFIGILDLTRAADLIRGQTYDALMPLIVVALIYLVIVLFLQFLIKKMERRLNNAY